jgi:hypothetical protein
MPPYGRSQHRAVPESRPGASLRPAGDVDYAQLVKIYPKPMDQGADVGGRLIWEHSGPRWGIRRAIGAAQPARPVSAETARHGQQR